MTSPWGGMGSDIRVAANTELIDELRLSWSRLLPLHPMLGDGVLTRLSGPGRAFHDTLHLKHCLLALAQLGGAERAEYLALWYHNAVNSGTRGHHVQASAAVAATELLGAGFPWVEVGLVARLVLVTEDHRATPDLPGSDRVSDADLAELAGPFARVEAAFQSRRAEMSDLPPSERDQWLRSWIEDRLRRDRILSTERGHELWEAQARRNLEALLKEPVLV